MSMIRSRWAALGAAVAITLGGGGIGLVNATVTSGERTVFVPVTPCRIVDTRPAFQVGAKSSPLGPGEIVTVSAHGIHGRCTIPSDAVALSLNVTALGATLPTFLTVWATGAARPDSSSLNPSPGAPPTPNAVATDLSPDGRFGIYNLRGSVHVFADVNGYYAHHNHHDQYYTKAQVRSVAAAEVIVTDGLFVPEFSFVPEDEFGGIAETVTTSKKGHLHVTKYLLGRASCSPATGAGRLVYITVDGVGLRSSMVFSDSSDDVDVQLSGVTEAPVPAGDHEIGVGVECHDTNTASVTSTTFVTNASVVVLPSG